MVPSTIWIKVYDGSYSTRVNKMKVNNAATEWNLAKFHIINPA